MAKSEPFLEVEVKFLVKELAAVRAQLLSLGAVMAKPRSHEYNVLFDTENRQLLRELKLLRLRQDGRVRLTFKGEAPQENSEAKVREELEIGVSDFETAVQILRRLGYAPVQVYEKYRETFHWAGVEVVLDEMPFGYFIELEGTETAIKTAALQLGFDWSKRILSGYLALMAQLKAHHQLPFNDLTFANFAGCTASISDLYQ